MNRLLLTIACGLSLTGVAYAADHSHMNHTMATPEPDDHGAMAETFMVEKEIDGYTVTFHVMPTGDDMKSMGADSLMLKIEKEGVVVTDVVVNTKVIFPDGTEKSEPVMVMGDWLMAGYDLAKEGRHQLMVLFKTADGKKHFGGVYYP